MDGARALERTEEIGARLKLENFRDISGLYGSASGLTASARVPKCCPFHYIFVWLNLSANPVDETISINRAQPRRNKKLKLNMPREKRIVYNNGVSITVSAVSRAVLYNVPHDGGHDDKFNIHNGRYFLPLKVNY